MEMDAEERRERRKKLVRGIILYVLLLQFASTCVTAWQVRKAMLCTDTYYEYISSKDWFVPKDLGYEYDVVWYTADEVSISTIFNLMFELKEPGDSIRAGALPIGTLYGIGEKWVVFAYAEEIKSATGKLRHRHVGIPTILWYKWNGFRWEYYDMWEPYCPWAK